MLNKTPDLANKHGYTWKQLVFTKFCVRSALWRHHLVRRSAFRQNCGRFVSWWRHNQLRRVDRVVAFTRWRQLADDSSVSLHSAPLGARSPSDHRPGITVQLVDNVDYLHQAAIIRHLTARDWVARHACLRWRHILQTGLCLILLTGEQLSEQLTKFNRSYHSSTVILLAILVFSLMKMCHLHNSIPAVAKSCFHNNRDLRCIRNNNCLHFCYFSHSL